mmetsp:Transcript_44367/g.95584  ORF Transcript_44367/g.95584 Transcript_44367/m.95584 type:complete len:236 (+) Transcript_44367:1068-1775(+)
MVSSVGTYSKVLQKICTASKKKLRSYNSLSPAYCRALYIWRVAMRTSSQSSFRASEQCSSIFQFFLTVSHIKDLSARKCASAKGSTAEFNPVASTMKLPSFFKVSPTNAQASWVFRSAAKATCRSSRKLSAARSSKEPFWATTPSIRERSLLRDAGATSTTRQSVRTAFLHALRSMDAVPRISTMALYVSRGRLQTQSQQMKESGCTLLGHASQEWSLLRLLHLKLCTHAHNNEC